MGRAGIQETKKKETKKIKLITQIALAMRQCRGNISSWASREGCLQGHIESLRMVKESVLAGAGDQGCHGRDNPCLGGRACLVG